MCLLIFIISSGILIEFFISLTTYRLYSKNAKLVVLNSKQRINFSTEMLFFLSSLSSQTSLIGQDGMHTHIYTI